MIDLEKHLPITRDDVETIEKIRQERMKPLSLDEYLEILERIEEIFPDKKIITKKEAGFDRPFEF